MPNYIYNTIWYSMKRNKFVSIIYGFIPQDGSVPSLCNLISLQWLTRSGPSSRPMCSPGGGFLGLLGSHLHSTGWSSTALPGNPFVLKAKCSNAAQLSGWGAHRQERKRLSLTGY